MFLIRKRASVCFPFFLIFYSFEFTSGLNVHIIPILVVLEKVEQCCANDLPIKLKNPPICKEFLYHFLTGTTHKLSLLPEGSFLLAERQPDSKEFTSKEFKFSVMNESEMDPIKFFGKKFVVSVFDQKRIECITTRELSFCISVSL